MLVQHSQTRTGKEGQGIETSSGRQIQLTNTSENNVDYLFSSYNLDLLYCY